MRSRIKIMRFAQLLLAMVFFSLTVCSVEAQDTKNTQEVSQFRNKEISLLRNKIEWALSDMVRLVEEIRRIDSPWSKRLLVEEVENILFREVEIPLYMYGDNFASRVKKDDQAKMTELYARAFAMAGIARIFEGFTAAADTYLENAKEIYPEVAKLSVKIDSFEAPRTIQEWIDEGRSRDKPPQAVRIAFHTKKNIPQTILDNLVSDTVRIQGAKGQEYVLHVASHDFLRGLSRKIGTAKVLTDQEDQQFFVYLPPGKYEIIITAPKESKNQFQVHPDSANNHLIVEGRQDGLSIYPTPMMIETKETAKTSPNQPTVTGPEKN